jgi:hypothetical protein
LFKRRKNWILRFAIWGFAERAACHLPGLFQHHEVSVFWSFQKNWLVKSGEFQMEKTHFKMEKTNLKN